MNNKTYFYRVANIKYRFYDIYPLGPYSFFNPTVWKNSKILPYTEDEYKTFVKFCEHEVVEYKKLKIDNFKLKIVTTLPNAWRPGPFEDIELREKMIEKMGGITKCGKFHLYGFDSMIQLMNWYNNHEELQFLDGCGFSLYKFRVKRKNMIFGKSQAVYFPDINDKNEMLIMSIIKLTDLNKPVTVSATECVSELFL